MVPLKEGLYQSKDTIKALGGKWNGHIWCVPPDVKYINFIKYMPYELVQRINFYEVGNSISNAEDHNNQIVLAWSIQKSIINALLKMVSDEIKANSMVADRTFEETINFIQTIEWSKIEKTLEETSVESYKPIPIAGKENKYCPRGIYIWSQDFSNIIGWSDMFDDTTFFSTGPAYELYLSDQLKFIYFEIASKEFFHEGPVIHTSRKPIDDETIKDQILIQHLLNIWDCGENYTEEIINILIKHE